MENHEARQLGEGIILPFANIYSVSCTHSEEYASPALEKLTVQFRTICEIMFKVFRVFLCVIISFFALSVNVYCFSKPSLPLYPFPAFETADR